MRVGVDARCLNTPHLRGMGKALLAVLEAAAARVDLELVLFADEPRHPIVAPAGARVETHVWEVRGHRFRAWEQYGLPRAARRFGCDVLHATGTWAPWWQPVPTVVTVHDTIPWDGDNEEGLSRFFLDTLQPQAYRKARAILTPSVNSKNDIARRWPALAGKVNVIPWGIAPAYTSDAIPKLDPAMADLGVRAPYIVYVGGHVERKRLAWAIDVWQQATPPDVRLVVLGLAPATIPDWRARVDESRRALFQPMPFVDESLLPGVYAQAIAVLYPTLYEGFGFPALEAQAVGRPVLMSAVGSLQELAGPGAIVLPTDDRGAWIDACRRVVASPPPIDVASRQWARRFSWTAAGDALAAAYKAACGRSDR